MSTQVTEWQAKLSSDTTEVVRGIERTKKAVDDLKKAAGDQSAATAASNQFASASTKAANAVQGTVNAIGDLQKRGVDAFSDLASQGAQFASVLGPTGAIVGAASIATVAIVSIFVRAKKELSELRQAFQAELRQLERSGDVAGLSKRRQALFSGDRLFGDPGSEDERGNDQLRRFNEAARKGGIEGITKAIAEQTIKVRELEKANARSFGELDVIREQRAQLTQQREELRRLIENTGRTPQGVQRCDNGLQRGRRCAGGARGVQTATGGR